MGNITKSKMNIFMKVVEEKAKFKYHFEMSKSNGVVYVGVKSKISKQHLQKLIGQKFIAVANTEEMSDEYYDGFVGIIKSIHRKGDSAIYETLADEIKKTGGYYDAMDKKFKVIVEISDFQFLPSDQLEYLMLNTSYFNKGKDFDLEYFMTTRPNFTYIKF